MKALRLMPLSLMLAGVALAGCGSLGDLERPAPMDPAKRAAWEAERRAASADANQPAPRGSNREILDPATATGPARETPIGGAANDPFAGPGGDPR